MRLFIALALVMLLVGCAFQSEQGKGLVGFNKQAQQETAITGQVISDIYNTNPCMDDTDCGPSQVCINQTCHVKN